MMNSRASTEYRASTGRRYRIDVLIGAEENAKAFGTGMFPSKLAEQALDTFVKAFAVSPIDRAMHRAGVYGIRAQQALYASLGAGCITVLCRIIMPDGSPGIPVGILLSTAHRQAYDDRRGMPLQVAPGDIAVMRQYKPQKDGAMTIYEPDLAGLLDSSQLITFHAVLPEYMGDVNNHLAKVLVAVSDRLSGGRQSVRLAEGDPEFVHCFWKDLGYLLVQTRQYRLNTQVFPHYELLRPASIPVTLIPRPMPKPSNVPSTSSVPSVASTCRQWDADEHYYSDERTAASLVPFSTSTPGIVTAARIWN